MGTSNNKHIATLQEFSIPLIGGVILALVWANISPHSYHHFIHWSPLGPDSHFNFHFLMNDIFMVIFFGLAAKEITESVLPGGALNPVKKAINPLLGTLGGVFGPIGAYLAWVAFTGDQTIAGGWGIPTATDIALAWLLARMIFGNGHPAVNFLLLLAVADDGIGLGIIAVFYPDPNHPVQPAYLGLVLGAMAFAYALRKKDVRNFWYYLIGPGILSWVGLFLAHLHPALALVAIVPFMPAGTHDEGIFEESGDHYTDTLNVFEHFFKLPVDIGLLGFGLANAGVELSTVGNATVAVLLGLAVGKTAGIYLFSMAGHYLGFPLPDGMNGKSLFITGLVAGLGLTVALFVAGVAFTDPNLQGAAKMGALLSALIAPLAFITARAIGIRREDQDSAPKEETTVVVRPEPIEEILEAADSEEEASAAQENFEQGESRE